MKKEILDKAKALEPLIRIGKNGITEGQLSEIRKQLKKKKMVKIRFLRNFIETVDKKKAAHDVACKTHSEIVLQLGFTVVLLSKQ